MDITIELWGKKDGAWGYGSWRCLCGKVIFLHLRGEGKCEKCGCRGRLQDKHTVVISPPEQDTKESEPMATVPSQTFRREFWKWSDALDFIGHLESMYKHDELKYTLERCPKDYEAQWVLVYSIQDGS